MSNQPLPSDMDAPRARTHEFILSTVVPAEPRPGERPQSVIDIETSDAITTKTGALLDADPKEGSALSSMANVDCSEAIHPVIDRAIRLCGDGVSDSVPLASYLNNVRPLRIRDSAIQTHEWALSRRPSARRKIAGEAGEPYPAEMCSELAGVH